VGLTTPALLPNSPEQEGRQSLWCDEKLLTCVAYASKEEYSPRATVAFSGIPLFDKPICSYL
jgi:hypothetical protein